MTQQSEDPIELNDGALDSERIQQGLRRLENVCSEYSQTRHNLRETACEVADFIVRQIEAADLVGVRLPRDYEVRSCVGELYLLKCRPAGQEVRFIANGADTSFVRLCWNTRKTTYSQAREFACDVANGLMDEIVVMVEQHLNQTVRATAQLRQAGLKAIRQSTAESSPAAPPPAESSPAETPLAEALSVEAP